MTKEEYFLFASSCMERMLTISKAKNNDYTGASVSPFANFSRVEALGICTTEQGFLTRMSDKLSRAAALLVDRCERKVKDEQIEDTLLDLANYCILLCGYLESKKDKN
jgi:hypothetical protein